MSNDTYDFGHTRSATDRLGTDLSPYFQYYLPKAGLGQPFLESVRALFYSLSGLRVDANRTAAPESAVAGPMMARSIPTQGWPLQDVIDRIITHSLSDVPNYSGGYGLCNVIPPSLTPAILAKIACAIINPNLAHGTYGGRALEAEQIAIAHIADILGLDATQAGGYFTSGGTTSNYWAMRYALEKAFPGMGKTGFPAFANKRPVIFQSILGHYTNVNAARLLGVGSDNVIMLPVTPSFSLDVRAFHDAFETTVQQGQQVVCIYLVAGCTDSFGVDDVESVYHIREDICDRYQIAKPHIHVDGAIGWMYGIFRNYDTAENRLNFDLETLQTIEQLNALYAGLRYADSITVDLHKQGFVSYAASALILKDKRDLALFQKSDAETPYFNEDDFRAFPGAYTFETSRAGDGPLMTLANLYALGYDGYQTLIGHALRQTNRLKARLQDQFNNRIHVLNEEVPGASAIWRVYPPGIDARGAYRRELFGTTEEDRHFTQEMNDYNHALFAKRRALSDERAPILGYSQKVIESAMGTPISAWKCVLFHPLANITAVINSLHTVLEQTPTARPRPTRLASGGKSDENESQLDRHVDRSFCERDPRGPHHVRFVSVVQRRDTQLSGSRE